MCKMSSPKKPETGSTATKQDGADAIFTKPTKRHNSAEYHPILMTFDAQVHNGMINTLKTPSAEYIKDGCLRHFNTLTKSHISAIYSSISMKIDTYVQNSIPSIKIIN